MVAFSTLGGCPQEISATFRLVGLYELYDGWESTNFKLLQFNPIAMRQVQPENLKNYTNVYIMYPYRNSFISVPRGMFRSRGIAI